MGFHSPLIRPAIYWGGVPLDSHDNKIPDAKRSIVPIALPSTRIEAQQAPVDQVAVRREIF